MQSRLEGRGPLPWVGLGSHLPLLRAGLGKALAVRGDGLVCTGHDSPLLQCWAVLRQSHSLCVSHLQPWARRKSSGPAPPRDPGLGRPLAAGPRPSQLSSSSPGTPSHSGAGRLGLRVTCGAAGTPGSHQHVAEAQVSPGSGPHGHGKQVCGGPGGAYTSLALCACRTP